MEAWAQGGIEENCELPLRFRAQAAKVGESSIGCPWSNQHQWPSSSFSEPSPAPSSSNNPHLHLLSTLPPHYFAQRGLSIGEHQIHEDNDDEQWPGGCILSGGDLSRWPLWACNASSAAEYEARGARWCVNFLSQLAAVSSAVGHV